MSELLVGVLVFIGGLGFSGIYLFLAQPLEEDCDIDDLE